MKILLINPPKTQYPQIDKASDVIDVGLPLGLLYLAAMIEREGYEVKILDCLISEEAEILKLNNGTIQYGLSWEKIKTKVEQFKPQIVGVTCQFSAQVHNTIKVTEVVKEINSSLPVIVGGPHVTVMAKQFLEAVKTVDFAVIGEGEYTILELLQYFEGKVRLEDIKGLAFRKNGEIIINPKREFIQDLDKLHLPAYHLIDMGNFFSLAEKGIYSRSRGEKRCVSVITSRGCPFGCVFCSVHLSMGRGWRAHSPDYVIKHIKFLVAKYHVKHIHFEDDNLTLNLNRFNEILDRLLENRLNIKWDTPNGVRADRLNIRLLKKMKKTGCIQINIGIESGDQEVLDKIIKKSLNIDQAVETVKLCKEVGIPVGAFFMIGLPGEKKENMQKTMDLALRLMKEYGLINSGGAMFATPLYGTELYKICEENNIFAKPVTPEALAVATHRGGEGLIKTEDFTPEDLKRFNEEFAIRAFRLTLINYFKNPVKLIKKVLLDPQKIWVWTKKYYGALKLDHKIKERS
jgi:magnesium-protoporphyrin IX monomethyl ester (oxidative) cyclase